MQSAKLSIKKTTKNLYSCQKGADGVNNIHVVVDDCVHKSCRKRYVNTAYVDNATMQGSTCSTRLSTGGFDFRSNCYLCGKAVTTRVKQNKEVVNVACKNKEVDKAIKDAIALRGNDP